MLVLIGPGAQKVNAQVIEISCSLHLIIEEAQGLHGRLWSALLDFQKASHKHMDLLHPSNYAFCQSAGARIHREGHPAGALTNWPRNRPKPRVVLLTLRLCSLDLWKTL